MAGLGAERAGPEVFGHPRLARLMGYVEKRGKRRKSIKNHDETTAVIL